MLGGVTAPHVTPPMRGPPPLGIKTVKRCGVGAFHVPDMFVKLFPRVAK